MLEGIYYLVVLWFVWVETQYILDVDSKTTRNNRFLELSKEHKAVNAEWSEFSPEYKTILKNVILEPILMLSMVGIGFFTIHWPIWLGFFILNIFIVAPISKRVKRNKNKVGQNILTWLNSVLGLVVGLFVLINKYHLHYDIPQIVENFLK